MKKFIKTDIHTKLETKSFSLGKLGRKNMVRHLGFKGAKKVKKRLRAVYGIWKLKRS